MNRSIYQKARRSIRDNGLLYTTRHAIDISDTDTLLVCDAVASLMRETDWLDMRAMFSRTGSKAHAIRLTTSILKTA